MSGPDCVTSVYVLAQSGRPVTLVGRPGTTGEGPGFPWAATVLGTLCIAAAALVCVRAWQRRSKSPGRRALAAVSTSLGLTSNERKLIETIGAPQPAAMLISEHAFGTAVRAWLATEPSEAQRGVLGALATRLGWSMPTVQEAAPPAPVAPVQGRKLRLVA